MQFQVEGCLSLGNHNWAAVSSALTGSFWCGGLSIFHSEGSGPLVGKYQWSCEDGGLTCLTKLTTDQTVLVTGGMDGTVSLHPLHPPFEKTTFSVETYTTHNAPVSALAADPKNPRFVSAGWDNKIILHTVGENAAYSVINSVLAHYKKINALAWASESSFFSGGDDGEIKLWDIRDSKLGTKPSLILNSFGPAFALSLAQSNIAVGHEDGVYIYDNRKSDGPHIAKFNFGIPVKTLEFSPKSASHIAVGADDGRTCVLELSGTNLNVVYEGKKHTDFVRGVCWDDSGARYVSGGWGVHADKALDVTVHEASF